MLRSTVTKIGLVGDNALDDFNAKFLVNKHQQLMVNCQPWNLRMRSEASFTG
jgi:hypothetical protein